MIGLANFLTKGRIQAIVGLSFFTLFSAFIPPLANLLSGTVIGLIALRQGPILAIQVIIGSLGLIGLMLIIAGLDPKNLLLFALGIWLPVMFAAVVLRTTRQQGMMLTIAGLIAVMFIFSMHYQATSVAADYRDVFESFWQQNILPNLSAKTTVKEINAMKQMLDNLIPLMNGIRASFIAISIICTVLLARWWQSKVFNPGGFRPEFLALNLPKALLLPLAVCAGIVFMNGMVDDSIARDCLIVLMSLYVFQGIACVHAFVARRPEQRGWLVGMYISLVFISLYAAIILSCIGVADSVMGRKLPVNPA